MDLLMGAQQNAPDERGSRSSRTTEEDIDAAVLDEIIAQTPLETLVGQHMRGIERGYRRKRSSTQTHWLMRLTGYQRQVEKCEVLRPPCLRNSHRIAEVEVDLLPALAARAVSGDIRRVLRQSELSARPIPIRWVC